MILFINTCVENKIILAVKEKGEILKKECEIKDRQAENMVIALDNFFTFFKKNINELSGVIVVNGPGKFTSLRVGISTANAISYALNLPITDIRSDGYDNLEEAFLICGKRLYDKSKYAYIKPFYDKEPNITSKKQENKFVF